MTAGARMQSKVSPAIFLMLVLTDQEKVLSLDNHKEKTMNTDREKPAHGGALKGWRKTASRHRNSRKPTRHGRTAFPFSVLGSGITVPDPNPPLPPRVHHAYAGRRQPTPGEGIVGRVRRLRGSYGATAVRLWVAGRRSGRGHCHAGHRPVSPCRRRDRLITSPMMHNFRSGVPTLLGEGNITD
jgi:hypothetical protein